MVSMPAWRFWTVLIVCGLVSGFSVYSGNDPSWSDVPLMLIIGIFTNCMISIFGGGLAVYIAYGEPENIDKSMVLFIQIVVSVTLFAYHVFLRVESSGGYQSY